VMDEMPQISIHALYGVHTYQTMKVTGKAENATLHILIDLGSTHNFLDTTVAKRLHSTVKKIPSLQVALANGQELNCNTMCKDFS